MYNLSELYYPITANPKGAGEILPCKALRPYIRCFWGSSFLEETYRGEPEKQLNDPSAPSLGGEIIIPDSCMDIIWEWDEQTGESGGIFAGLTIRLLKPDKLTMIRGKSASPSASTSGPCTCSPMTISGRS